MQRARRGLLQERMVMLVKQRDSCPLRKRLHGAVVMKSCFKEMNLIFYRFQHPMHPNFQLLPCGKCYKVPLVGRNTGGLSCQ